LKTNGAGKHAVEAATRIEELTWQQASAVNTIESLEDYLKNCDTGKHVAEARSRIEELKLREVFLESASAAERATALAAWEEAIEERILADETLRKAPSVLPVLMPAADGSLVRCTFRMEDNDSGQGKASLLAQLEAPQDEIPVTGFQTLVRGSILRFSGTVRFPFVVPDLLHGMISGTMAYHSQLAGKVFKNRPTNTMYLNPEWSDSAATFTGEPGDPLAFLLLDNGLVYFHGTGSVRFADGKTIMFGDSNQEEATESGPVGSNEFMAAHH
jgi:hypothetical protein